jgi:hypothetical protein
MPRKTPVLPPIEIVDRIKREVAAPRFVTDLTIWADRQCGRLLSIEGRLDPQKATELVNAAVVDTCDGVRTWNPAARTLRRHLEQTINSRLWHECERMRRRRFITFATTSADDSQDGAAAIEIEMSEQQEDPRTRPDVRLAQREVRTKIFDVLRERAAQDTELIALLDAYEAGHCRQADAEARVGVRGQAFQNLIRRFKTIRGHIPPELRSAAFEAMVRDGGAPLASVARRQRREVEIIADREAANDSGDSTEALDLSGDGDDGADRDAA